MVRRLCGLSIVVILCALSGVTHAGITGVTYNFQHIVEPGEKGVNINGAIGEAQLFLDVSDISGSALFTFTNTGPLACSITDVYFSAGGILSSIIAIDNSDPGVLFSKDAKPANLPGGNLVSPPFTTTLSADSDKPIVPNGVNPGETLGVLFDLTSGRLFGDVIGGLNDGSVRVGLKVQGFETGDSETFVHKTVVPTPGACGLAAMGLGLVSFLRRRKAI